MVDLGKRDCVDVLEKHHSVETLSLDCQHADSCLDGAHFLAIKRGDDLGLNPAGGSIFKIVVSVWGFDETWKITPVQLDLLRAVQYSTYVHVSTAAKFSNTTSVGKSLNFH